MLGSDLLLALLACELLNLLLGVVGSPLLDVGGQGLFVLGPELLLLLVSEHLGLLDHSLSPESLLGNESLDLGGLVEGLVALLDLAPHDVLPHVVGLAESEHLPDVVGSLGSELPGLLAVGDAFDLGVSLLGDLQGDDGQVGSANAPSDGFSLSLSSSSGSVARSLYLND